MKSLQAQIDAMELDWPQFQSCPGVWPNSVVWFGDLKGIEGSRSFRILIEYGLPMLGQNDLYRQMPVVRVLDPPLVPNWEAEEERPLPHIYFDSRIHFELRGYFESLDIRLSPLCLFDPKAGEWNHSMLISKTTVVWTMRWLAAYEFWEATGQWNGGGRHDGIEVKRDENHAA